MGLIDMGLMDMGLMDMRKLKLFMSEMIVSEGALRHSRHMHPCPLRLTSWLLGLGLMPRAGDRAHSGHVSCFDTLMSLTLAFY